MMLWPAVWINIVAAALGAAGAWGLRDMRADAQVSKLREQHAEQFATWEREARESSETQRESERLARRVVTKEAQDARTQSFVRADRAADLRAVSDQLRQRADAAATAEGQSDGDPGTAVRSQAAAGAGLVFADMHRGDDREAQELAVAFDAARAAGLVCERTYDAVGSISTP